MPLAWPVTTHTCLHMCASMCRYTPAHAHRGRHSPPRAHTHRGILAHLYHTRIHVHTHTDAVAPFRASVVVFDADLVVGSPQELVVSPSACPQDPVSHASAGIKGALRALGSREHSLHTLVKVLTGWSMVRRECWHESGEALGCALCSAPTEQPKVIMGASKMRVSG